MFFELFSLFFNMLGVVGNAIYVLLQISSDMLLPKIMKIGSRIKTLLQKEKGYSFFETQCSSLRIKNAPLYALYSSL